MAADDKKDVLILGRIGADDRLDPQSADQPAGEDVHAETRPRERNVDQEVLVSGTGEAAEQGHEDDGTDLDVKTDDAANPDAEPGIDTETPLILAVQHILSLSGIAFSAGAVRDLPELTSETFDPTSAVSALRHVGFEANYGEMPVSTLEAGHCPAIAFAQNGAAVVIAEITEDGIAKVLHFQGEEEPLV